jgi:hypothetical protein
MLDQVSERDLNERLSLIENMIAEGRRSTESWGWVFLLWGAAYFIAIAWASAGHGLSVWGSAYAELGGVRTGLAWPVTMMVAVIVTLAIGLRKGRTPTGTTVVRAIVSVWVSAGISMLLLFPALGLSGRLDQHTFVAIVAAMLAVSNSASGMILRWKAQMMCAIVWWITSAVACFGTVAQVTAAFLIGVFLCQIVFGTYAMILESRRNRREIAHA